MLATFCVLSEDFLLICFRITPRIIVGLTTRASSSRTPAYIFLIHPRLQMAILIRLLFGAFGLACLEEAEHIFSDEVGYDDNAERVYL